MATVVVCVACAQAVPNSRDRRRVQSESARQTLSEIVSRVYPNAVSVFIPAENPAIVCRSCFGHLAAIIIILSCVRRKSDEHYMRLAYRKSCASFETDQSDLNLLHSCGWHGKLSIVPRLTPRVRVRLARETIPVPACRLIKFPPL